MCGIVGIVSKEPVNQAIYDALTAIQHRGQDAAGIMTAADGRVFLRKHNGLVRDVIQYKHMTRLRGNIGIGHVRYPTAGSACATESQPFYVNAPYGIGLAHNGNLTNRRQCAVALKQLDRRHLNTDSDSEVLLNILASELAQQSDRQQDALISIKQALVQLYQRVQGGYAAVSLINGLGVLAFRDPHGIRPLVYGQNDHSVVVASESAALEALGINSFTDVPPGGGIFITPDGEIHSLGVLVKATHRPCLFEFVYFARPDSIIDGISVVQARMMMGQRLAQSILKQHPGVHIDAVIPIPDTARTAAIEVAKTLGVDYREGFMKNRYIGRTFIMPGQATRKRHVRLKLNPITREFAGRSVLLIDDSIVRGTTSMQIVDCVRQAGASKVYFASAAPMVCYPNIYGIDMPCSEELVAYQRSEAQVAQHIGADWLVYLSLDDLVASVNAANQGGQMIDGYEDSVFTGNYVTPVDADYFAQLAVDRADHALGHQPKGMIQEGQESEF